MKTRLEHNDHICVLGAGSFGTAIAHYAACHIKKPILLYGRNPRTITAINTTHTNPGHLPGVDLSSHIIGTDSLEHALHNSRVIISAVPAQQFRSLLQSIKETLPTNSIILNLAKGIEQKSCKRMSEVACEILGKNSLQRYAALSGPSFAEDIARQKPVGVTVSGNNSSLLFALQKLLSSPLLDIKVTTDLVGIETAGALKNIFAIAAGVFAGCGHGASITGSYISRAMVEMRSLGLLLGSRWVTYSGRSGLGDLVITCSESSRNFRFGRIYTETALQNPGLDHHQLYEQSIAALGSSTVEGYATLDPVFAITRTHNIFTPIIDACYQLFYEGAFAPSDLYSVIARNDEVRATEGPGFFSLLMHHLFPGLWYRRRKKNHSDRR